MTRADIWIVAALLVLALLPEGGVWAANYTVLP